MQEAVLGVLLGAVNDAHLKLVIELLGFFK